MSCEIEEYLEEYLEEYEEEYLEEYLEEYEEEYLEEYLEEYIEDEDQKYKKTFTLTFGDQGENHAGMQKIGKLLDKGMSVEEIDNIQELFEKRGYVCDRICLNNLLDEEAKKKVDGEAVVLVIRGGLKFLLNDVDPDLFFEEQDSLEKDKKAMMRGRVVNKNARYNLCFSDFDQKADFENGKGTVVHFDHVPLLNTVRKNISKHFGDKCKHMIAEGNYYYDPSICGIGYHGDSERRVIVGIRVGASMPLHFRWYYKGEIVSPTQKMMLDHGDVYVSSEKAVGFDWKKSSKYTLRHAAGCDKFLDTKNDM